MAGWFSRNDPATRHAHDRCLHGTSQAKLPAAPFLSSITSPSPSPSPAAKAAREPQCGCTQFYPELIFEAAGTRVTGSCMNCRHDVSVHAETTDFPLRRAMTLDAFDPPLAVTKLKARALLSSEQLRAFLLVRRESGSSCGSSVETRTDDGSEVVLDSLQPMRERAGSTGVATLDGGAGNKAEVSAQPDIHFEKGNAFLAAVEDLLLAVQQRDLGGGGAGISEPWLEEHLEPLWGLNFASALSRSANPAHSLASVSMFARDWHFAVLDAALIGLTDSSARSLCFLRRNAVAGLASLARPSSASAVHPEAEMLLLAVHALIASESAHRVKALIPDAGCLNFLSAINMLLSRLQSGGHVDSTLLGSLVESIAQLCDLVVSTVERFLRADEIRITERVFCDKLRHLLQCFECGEVAEVHITALFETHERVLARMNAVLDSWDETSCMAGVITKQDLNAMQPFYQQFLSWQSAFIEQSPSWFKANAVVQNLVSAVTTRVQRWELLFSELLKRTPKDHPDFRELEDLVEEIRSFMGRTNDEALVKRVGLAIQIRRQTELAKTRDPLLRSSLSSISTIEFLGKVEPFGWSSADANPEVIKEFTYILVLTVDSLILLRQAKTGLGKPPANLQFIFDVQLVFGVDNVYAMSDESPHDLAIQFSEPNQPIPQGSKKVATFVSGLVTIDAEYKTYVRTSCSARFWSARVDSALALARQRVETAAEKYQETWGEAAQRKNASRAQRQYRALLEKSGIPS